MTSRRSARLLFSLPLLNTNWSYQYHRQPGSSRHPRGGGLALPRAPGQRAASEWRCCCCSGPAARRLFSETDRQFRARPGRPFARPDRPFFPGHHRWHRLSVRLCQRACSGCAIGAIPPARQAAILGVLLGGLLLAKFNSPPLFALLLLLCSGARPRRVRLNPRGFQWRRTAAIFLIACLVVWSGYFFHVSKVTFADQMVTIHFAGYTKLLQYEMPTLTAPPSPSSCPPASG